MPGIIKEEVWLPSLFAQPLFWNHFVPKGSVNKQSEVAQSCLTLCDPMDSSLWSSSIHGIFQARVLEWAAISFSRGASQPKDRTLVSHIASKCFYRLSHQGKPGNLFLPGLKPGTFHMWGEPDNHYTTETGQGSGSPEMPWCYTMMNLASKEAGFSVTSALHSMHQNIWRCSQDVKPSFSRSMAPLVGLLRVRVPTSRWGVHSNSCKCETGTRERNQSQRWQSPLCEGVNRSHETLRSEGKEGVRGKREGGSKPWRTHKVNLAPTH